MDMRKPSGDYRAMADYWGKVEAIMGGVETMRAVPSYLPQFPAESEANHKYRVANSKFSNVFGGILHALAAKPFAREVAFTGTVSPRFEAMAEDIDGAGNHLHVFASAAFLHGLQFAIDWILVDYPVAQGVRTRADEQRAGVRPNWVRIPARNMLAVYSAVVDGHEQVVYARFAANETERSGADEVIVEKVRVLERPIVDGVYGRPQWQVWTLVEAGWTLESEGELSIDEIPLVAFAPGRRIESTWRFNAPLQSIAELQIEHYQQESNLKNAKELTAFPMLAGNGIVNPKETLVTGPNAVLYAPPNLSDGSHGQWSILEISATSLEFLAREVQRTEAQMHELGRQPLINGTAGITTVAAALTSQQASSALQAWAFQLKDSLEQAARFTAMWFGDSVSPTVFVNTDFQIGIGDDKAPDVLLKLHERNTISTETLREEMKRRGILSAEFDGDVENERLLSELPGDGADNSALSAAVVGDQAAAIESADIAAGAGA